MLSLSHYRARRNCKLMKTTRLSAGEWGERIVLALCFIAVGSLIMIVFSPWKPLLDKSSSDKILDYLGRIGLVVMLMVAVVWVRRSQRLEKYQPILVGLLILASAVSLDLIFGIYLIKHLGISD